MEHIKYFNEFCLNEMKIQINKILHDGIKVIKLESLNESAKHPELKRMLDTAKKNNDTLLIAEFIPEIEALVDKFFNSGQSGGSAPFTSGAIVDTIKKLMAHEPLGDGIENTDDEWGEGNIFSKDNKVPHFQNRRLSSVFKEGEKGKPYYLNAIVFKPIKNDCTFTSNSVNLSKDSKETIGSSQYVKSFPFQPKTFIIDVEEKEYRKNKDGSLTEEEGGGWWESWLADPTQLDKVWEYYDKK